MNLLHLAGPIRAVTLDVGGTLIEPWPSVGHVYAEVAAEAGFFGADAAQLNAQFAQAWARRGRFDHSRSAWAAVVGQTFEGICGPADCARLLPALYDRFAAAKAWRVFPDVWPVLHWLRENHLPLAAISNWDERLPPLLRDLGLAESFVAVLVSREVGFEKPHPEIFRRAEQTLQIPAREILHVGDNLEEDVHGAQACGFQALQVVRAGGVPGSLGALTELRGLVARANA